jgi:hypothetical protein
MPAFRSHLPFGLASAQRSEEIAEAREALDYWRRREETLPWRRRAARAEARSMTARWRERLISAHLERWGVRSDSVIYTLVALLPMQRREQQRLLAAVMLRNPMVRRLRRMAILACLALAAVMAMSIAVATQVL